MKKSEIESKAKGMMVGNISTVCELEGVRHISKSDLETYIAESKILKPNAQWSRKTHEYMKETLNMLNQKDRTRDK